MAVRGDYHVLQRYAGLLNYKMSASVKYLVGATLLAILLRRWDREAWDETNMSVLMGPRDAGEKRKRVECANSKGKRPCGE